MARAIQDITETLQPEQPRASRQSRRGASDVDDALPKSFIAQLFMRLQATFGHRWISLIPDETTQAIAINEWQHRLRGITRDEVARGFERMADRSGDSRNWPPGAAEFRALCRPHREPYERAEFQGTSLPQLPADRQTAQAHIDALRGHMRGVS